LHTLHPLAQLIGKVGRDDEHGQNDEHERE
jgi:hypothetical protein